VSIAFGSVYSTLGAIGGSENSVLIGHNHTYVINQAGGGAGSGYQGDNSAGTTQTTSNAGGSETGEGKNMQPYVVELKIMRIA